MLDPEECTHPMSQRSFQKARVKGEMLTVEVCSGCGIQILSPFDTNRLLGRTRKLKSVRH